LKRNCGCRRLSEKELARTPLDICVHDITGGYDEMSIFGLVLRGVFLSSMSRINSASGPTLIPREMIAAYAIFKERRGGAQELEIVWLGNSVSMCAKTGFAYKELLQKTESAHRAMQ
jgi:hypothetical protein